MFWNASDLKPFTNFAMPFSSHGHIHTTKLAKFVLEQTEINSFESFEKKLQDNLYVGAFGSLIPPYMACLEYNVLITNIAEKVSDPKPFEYGTGDFGINERYLQDYKIDYDLNFVPENKTHIKTADLMMWHIGLSFGCTEAKNACKKAAKLYGETLIDWD